MPVLLTRASEKYFIIKKINIFKCVIFRKMPFVARVFRFLDIVLDAVNIIIYYY
jgi:hypothetical protein